jgi:co-chaperonin GroES (HSP10)
MCTTALCPSAYCLALFFIAHEMLGLNVYPFVFQTGAQVVYSKYAGTEVEFNDSKHLILKEDDIIGILETDDVKDMKPLNDRVLIKVFINSFSL